MCSFYVLVDIVDNLFLVHQHYLKQVRLKWGGFPKILQNAVFTCQKTHFGRQSPTPNIL